MNRNQQLPGLRVHIRWMLRRDLPEVLEIEKGSFEFPWSDEDFYRCLRQRNCVGMVAEHGERVIGFMIYELHKTRLHVMNFAVHPEYRRRRIGAQMSDKIKGKLGVLAKSTLDVRESNVDAQLFWQSMGYMATEVYRGFRDDSPEDAYRFEYYADADSGVACG